MVGRIACLAVALLGCATTDPLDIGFRGPGRLVVVFERDEEELGSTSALRVFDAGGSYTLGVAHPREARWLSPHELVVAEEEPGPEPAARSKVSLWRVSRGRAPPRALGESGRLLDIAPDPSGEWLALIAELDDLGETELQIRNARTGELVARRAQTLDAPHWSPMGRHLVATQTRPDSEAVQTHGGVGFGGAVLSWPRLARLRRDLRGDLEALHDGADGGPIAAGGTIALWWAEAGIYARQRTGLVRCDPKHRRGCTLVYAPGPAATVERGCPVGQEGALLLVRRHQGPSELHSVSLATGVQQRRLVLPPHTSILSIDWVGP